MIIRQSNTPNWADWFRNMIVIKPIKEKEPTYIYYGRKRIGDYEFDLMTKNECYTNSFEYNDEVNL